MKLKPCPECGAAARYHPAQSGQWKTTDVVSCPALTCKRHIEEQRRNRFWYLVQPPANYTNKLRAWELWV